MISHDSASRDDALDQAIAEFLSAESAGQAGDRQQWLDRYPSCAAGLIEFFDDRERVHRLAMPGRFNQPSSSGDPEETKTFDTSDARADAAADCTPTPPEFAVPRYLPLNFHARGGMGEVWLAHDERIGRRVAVKKLRTGRDPQHARFLVEAQVTGQLEHPGVIPLHDLGIDDAGQPFYVMKFIHGRSLREAIEDYHAHKGRMDWPGEVQFLRLLESFVSVCNAVGYAHSKGVLHRDIKPSNVMLGPYGETLLLDWGLAKVMGQSEKQDETSVHVSASDSSTSHDGGIVGTPVYMSPEEAQGDAQAVDQSSDVYLLGSTLYEILTSRPPRQASSRWELIDLARKSRPVSPRKLDPRIPRALEAICLKAMAFRKLDRYPTAMALAEDVERFMAGETTVAYREPLPSRVARWMRRHRRGILRGLAILGVLALAAFALDNYRHARELADREHARVRLSDFYRLADEAQFYAANTDAVSERVPYYDPRRAETVGEAALAIAAPWGPQAERLPLPQQRADFRRAHYELLLLLARANLERDDETAKPRAALAHLDVARTIQPPSRGYYQLRGRCLTRLGQHEAARSDLDRAEHSDAPVLADDHFLAGEMLRSQDAGLGPDSIDDASQARRDRLVEAVAEYKSALRLDPRHYWAQYQLGRCLLALGRGPEAVEALGACIAMRPDSPWAYTTRGLASALSGQPPEALVDLNRALKLDPNFQPARLNRGVVHWLLDETDAALADFDAVLAAPSDTRLIEAGHYRSQLLLKKRRIGEALAGLSLVILARPDFRPAYWLRAQAHFRSGNDDEGQADVSRFLEMGKPASGVEGGVASQMAMGKALRRLALELDGEAKARVLVRAAREFSAAIESGPATAEHFLHLGAVQEMLGKAQEAIASYSKGLALRADHVAMRNARGWAYFNNEQLDLARADFAEALRRSPDDAEAHTGLGFAMAQAGAGDDARQEASRALLCRPNHYLTLHNVACIYGRLSASATEQKTEHENLALAALTRAVAIARQNGAGADEDANIRRETVAFPDSLRSRPEFQQLLPKQAAVPSQR